MTLYFAPPYSEKRLLFCFFLSFSFPLIKLWLLFFQAIVILAPLAMQAFLKRKSCCSLKKLAIKS